jgi:hypothetical protein
MGRGQFIGGLAMPLNKHFNIDSCADDRDAVMFLA